MLRIGMPSGIAGMTSNVTVIDASGYGGARGRGRIQASKCSAARPCRLFESTKLPICDKVCRYSIEL